jgi:uncharacterized protein (UPF0264 family)
MTRLLVSVRDAWEAGEAAAGGADLIDVKEPRFGSLGAASPETWDAVRFKVHSLCSCSKPLGMNHELVSDGSSLSAEKNSGVAYPPAGSPHSTGPSRPSGLLSAALGELLENRWSAVTSRLNGYAYAKIGLAGCGAVDGWEERWRVWIAKLPAATAPVAVIYADYKAADAPLPWQVVDAATRSPARTLLVDTFDKSGGDLFQRMSRCELLEIIQAAQSAGFQVALAGSITLERLADALRFQPDWIAVRGAVCRAGRGSALDRNLVERMAKRLSTPSESDLAPRCSRSVDYRPSGT